MVLLAIEVSSVASRSKIEIHNLDRTEKPMDKLQFVSAVARENLVWASHRDMSQRPLMVSSAE